MKNELGRRSDFLGLAELIDKLYKEMVVIDYDGTLTARVEPYKNLYFEFKGKKYVYELKEIKK